VPRVARKALPDGFFHVTARGVDRARIFLDDGDYGYFQASLDNVSERFGWKVHAHCLLPNHYHLIVESSREALSKGMQRLNGLYAQRFNRRHDRVGHLFQNRYASYVIENEEYFERAIAYVRANPVEAGLCERIEDWPWAGPLDEDMS
jgi:REP element-mobilizing transposase RayT